MRRRSRKYLLFVAFLLFLASYISSSFLLAYFREEYVTGFFDIIRKYIFTDDISCYQTNNSNTEYRYAPNSFYFYHTSCRKTISSHDACAIEAVARIHPSQKVYIISLNTIDPSNPIIKAILKLKNVKLSSINIINFADETPIDDLPDIIRREKRKYKVLADLLKIITLYRFGGTVLDWDIIVAKSLKKLGDNWIIKYDGVSLSMLKLSKNGIGRSTSGMILSHFQSKANHGYVDMKEVVKDTFEELCSASSVESINNKTCGGYIFYNEKLFHPISYAQRDEYLYPGYPEDSYAHQTWSENIKILPKDSLYVALARTHCPQIFLDFMYDFISDY